MKKKLIFAIGILAVMASCEKENIADFVKNEKQNAPNVIEFRDFVNNNTRASRKSGSSFVSGDAMAVWGFQVTDGENTLLFNNQKVEKTDTSDIWVYSPAKYWNSISSYDFYAFFPQSAGSTFDQNLRLFSVSDFTVNDNTDDQVDLMIAERKENQDPYNTVDYVFTHILSNVNFYFKASNKFDSSEVPTFELMEFDITGLYSTGDYAQSNWKNDNTPVGAWTADETSVYNFPEVTSDAPVVYNTGDAPSTIAGDLLLMPQTISENAKITLVYKINYADGTSQKMNRQTMLKNILGVKKSSSDTIKVSDWQPNFIYNYTVSVDPSVKNEPNGSVHHDDGGHGADAIIITKPDEDGDGYPEYWVDEDCDGEPDYPLVWGDPDGDGREELYPDHDGDGIPDYCDDDIDGDGIPNDEDPDFVDGSWDEDGDGIPDHLWIDKDGDGETDTEIFRKPEQILPPDVPTDPDDPDYPTSPNIDYNGGVDGYDTPSGYLEGKDTDGDGKADEYYVIIKDDETGEVTDTIPVIWADIDGDGKLEGVADKDKDGKLTPADSYDNDGIDYNGNDNDYDVIRVDTDGDGVCDTELEKIPEQHNDDDIDPDPLSNAIQFSATVSDWEEEISSEYHISAK